MGLETRPRTARGERRVPFREQLAVNRGVRPASCPKMRARNVAMLGLAIIFVIFWRIHFKNLDWWKSALAGAILAIPVGIMFHIVFGVNTKLNYDLGLSNRPKQN